MAAVAGMALVMAVAYGDAKYLLSWGQWRWRSRVVVMKTPIVLVPIVMMSAAVVGFCLVLPLLVSWIRSRSQ